MTWLPDDELAQFRADILDALPDTGVIQAVTRTSDGAGGWSESWSAVSGGTVACRLDPLKGSTVQAGVIAGQESLTLRYQVTVPYDAPLDADRRLVVNERTYEVVQLSDEHSWRFVRRAIVSEVR
jgi:head-tail adaptor